MYHRASISPLSTTQILKNLNGHSVCVKAGNTTKILKILNGHSVRIKAGNGPDIELSKEQLKKIAKAHQT